MATTALHCATASQSGILAFWLLEHFGASSCATLSTAFPMELINVVYYITGHGLGHATRSLELIRGLLMTKKYRVWSVSNVQASFFQHGLEEAAVPLLNAEGQCVYTHCERNLDSGGIQLDVIRMNTLGTLEKYKTLIHDQRQSILDFEVAWLKERNVQIVLLDATPMGSIAGKLAGAKVIFVTNFTWDYVFREMLAIVKRNGSASDEVCGSYGAMIKECEDDVSACDHIIRYPGATPLPQGFSDHKIVSGPLISRSVVNASIRSRYCPENEKLLLLGFGGFTVDWNLQDHFLPVGWRCIVLRANPEHMPSSRFVVVPEDAYVPDLIHAADVVLGKIGYGFVSECIVGGTPLVYVPRLHWPEEPCMEKLLTEDYGAGVAIQLEEYENGNWEPYLQQALVKKGTWKAPTYTTEDGVTCTATEKVVHLIEKLAHQ